MRDFSLPRRYAAVLIPFNAFAHNLTTDDQRATLRCCYRHLGPNAWPSIPFAPPKRRSTSRPRIRAGARVADPVDGHRSRSGTAGPSTSSTAFALAHRDSRLDELRRLWSPPIASSDALGAAEGDRGAGARAGFAES
jgi:hypothetical protein